MFSREDWILFRNIETLPQKAGVGRDKLALLVAKELADNALDACGVCEVEQLEGNGFYVKDHGEGIDPGQLAELFSINRPLLSNKLLRLPTRGAMGNGLRVVSGAVAATNGRLFVSTRGKRYEIILQPDGRSVAEEAGEYGEDGTRVEVFFGPGLEPDLTWAMNAGIFATGESYKGKTSGYWYTSEAFYELLQAHDGNVREIIGCFDGCTGAKAGVILPAYKNVKSNTLTFKEADQLLETIRENSRKVNPGRLGGVGEFGGYGYYKIKGEFAVQPAKGRHEAQIPFVVEAWVNYNREKDIYVFVNKSPITADFAIYKGKKDITLWGCGVVVDIPMKPGEVILSIITPYMPITSDGKSPDIGMLAAEIKEAVGRAGKRAKKLVRKEMNRSQKEVIQDCLEEAIDRASGDGEYRFSLRQLYYAVRPFVLEELGKEPEYGYFASVITEYEAEYGDIPLMYRDDRGTLYHPHLGEDIPIGTIAVENYERPPWTFNKVLYIEKEGFFNILKDKKIPEKYDMALLTSKGYASRAVKDLLDTMGEDAEEEITFFCIHDADAAGTKIYDTLQNETRARPGRKVKIINLGLDPEEAIEMGLEIEEIERNDRGKPVADYVGIAWGEWLQSHRVELNAMPTPVFLEWIERKISLYDRGKVLPPENIIESSLDFHVGEKLGSVIRDRLLQEQGYERKVGQAFEKVRHSYEGKIGDIRLTVKNMLAEEPAEAWSRVISDIAHETVEKNFKNLNF